MATTDTALASTEEIRRALGKLYELQEDDPNLIEGLFVKYPEKNPFTTWPLLKEPTEAFLRFFETTTPAPEQGVETITPQAGQYIETTTPLPNAIDAKKLEDLIDEFNTEIEAAKQGRLRASDAAKKFVAALKENAKRSNVVIPETQDSVVPDPESAPIPPERVQQIISATLQQPLPAEEQRLFFHALTSFASEEPNREVADLSRRATEVTETARVLSSPASTFPQAQSLSALATNSFQKGVARALDVVVPAAAKEAIINKILLQPLNNFVNHPEKIPQDVLGTMTDRWGANFVNSPWFTALRADANRMMADQKNALKVTTPLVSLVSDVATTVFRGPVTINVITYVETYRLVATQGVQMVSFPQYGSVALGYGSQVVHMAANYAIRKGVKAGVQAAAEKVAVSTAVKVGAEAVVGAGTGGIGTLVMLGADLLRGLVNKGLSVFKNLVGMGTSNAPEDKLLLVVGAGVVLVFFLPLFPLLNLPAFNQSMIDTSLATSEGASESGIIGSTTLSCAKTEGIYLSQADPGWGNLTYGGPPCTIASSACGPTSVTMILNAFGSPATVPAVAGRVAALDHNAGGSCSSSVSSNLLVLSGAGLSTLSIGTSWTEADQVLKNCGLIFAWGKAHRPLGDVWHFIVITGINWDTAGTSVVSYNTLDPAYPQATQNDSTYTVVGMWGAVK
jgi:hypothetical protein